MKRLVVLVAALAAGFTAYGQGTLNFNNRLTVDTVSGLPGVDAPIYLDTVGGTKLAGAGYYVALLGGKLTDTPVDTTGLAIGNLAVTTPTVGGAQSVVNFRTGAAAGYALVGAAGGRAVAGVGFGEKAQVQVVAWSAAAGSDWTAAFNAWKADASGTIKLGASAPMTITLASSSTSPTQPRLGAPLAGFDALGATPGLTSFAIVAVPEPSVIALGALGLLGALVIRRRK